MESLLSFEKFDTSSIIYRNGERILDEDGKISPTFDISMGMNRKHFKEGVVKISVSIGDEEIEENEYLFIEVLGFFSYKVEEEVTEDSMNDIYSINGTAILFPYLRSLVADVTSKGEKAAIQLPAINIFELMSENE